MQTMSQVDTRDASSTKRARTDGSRKEDDWTCPNCGNVNFSFRTTCNMRNCNQSKPSDYNTKSAVKPAQGSNNFMPTSPYFGAGAAAPSMNMGVPYGSLLNGSSVSPYGHPYSGSAPYNFNYSSRFSSNNPYRTLGMSGFPPYSAAASMYGTGGMYPVPSMMDKYGMGMATDPTMGRNQGFFSDNKPKRRDIFRDNDWTCPVCGNVNFSFRSVCNLKSCNTPRPGAKPSKPEKVPKYKMPEGSWKCEKCGNINFPFRTVCNIEGCGTERPTEPNVSGSPKQEENLQ